MVNNVTKSFKKGSLYQILLRWWNQERLDGQIM